MKRTLLLLVALCIPCAAHAQEPKVYQCVRQDGTVACTVTDTTGNPSVTCNHDCVDCNMVCTARLRLAGEDGNMVPVVPPQVRDQPPQPEAPGQVETPAYCNQKYQGCVSRCKSDPKDRSSYEMNACISSCKSWRSGCGTWNRSRDGD